MSDDQSSPLERGKRLKLLRSMTGLSKKEFCKKYKISSTSLHYWENAASNGISKKGALKVVKNLHMDGVHCTIAWLSHGLGIHPQFIDVRYAENITVSDDQEALNISDIKIIHYEIERFRQLNSGAIAFAIVDDGMDPFYRINDYVGGKRQLTNFNRFIDQDCIIETEDKQLFCRRFAAGNLAGFYNLYCVNPKTSVYPPILYNVKIISVVPITRLWRRNLS